MSNLDFDMVGLSPLAFPVSLSSSSLPPFDEGNIAVSFLQFCKNVLQKGKPQ